MVIDGRGRQLEPVGNLGPTTYTSRKKMNKVIEPTNEMAYAQDMASNILERLKEGERVVLFFHGGLNLQVDGMARADRLNKYGEIYDIPHIVYVNWQSSFLSSYRDRLFAIREGKDYRSRGLVKNTATKMTSPLYLAGDLVSSIGRLPISLERQLATGIQSSNPWRNDDIDDVQKEIESLKTRKHLPHFEFVENQPPHLSYILPSWLLYPFRIVTTPLVDGFGGPSWDVMQRRTTIMYEREVGKSHGGENHQGPLYTLGVALSEKLGSTTNYSGHFDLIGHSMGAILGSEFLRRFPGIHFNNVVFMAAACRVRDITDGVMPYLADKRNRDTQYFHLMLHPKAEIRESSAFHIAPEGSLLVWLDQMFEKPDASLDRMAGRYINMGLTVRFIEQEAMRLDPGLGQRMYFKTFPYVRGGLTNGPMKHGDFGKYEFWDKRFWMPGENGPYKVY
jgi:pimeloyl-ACP methyl ester carboxylesterase